MNVKKGARSPTTIPVTVETGPVNGTLVTSVVLGVNRTGGQADLEVTLTPTATTASSVTCAWVLAADGTDLAEHGIQKITAFLYGAGGVYLGESGEIPYPVDDRTVPIPT